MTTETDLSPEQARIKLAEALKEHSVTITTVFVPLANVPPERRKDFSESITWEYNVRKADQLISQGFYSCGIGCAKYSSPLIPKWNDKSIDAVNFRKQIQASGYSHPVRLLPPDPENIFGSLLMDASLGSESFEDFCANCGYDADSRKAEKIWHTCRNTFVELIQIFGTDELARLQAIAANL